MEVIKLGEVYVIKKLVEYYGFPKPHSEIVSITNTIVKADWIKSCLEKQNDRDEVTFKVYKHEVL